MTMKIFRTLLLVLTISTAAQSFSQCSICSTPAAPAEYGGTITATYYKGAVIQLWAVKPSVAICERDWYKVVGTDTTSLGTGDTLSVVSDTTCKYIARNKNTCSGANYYSSYVIMANITVVNPGTMPTYTISNSPVICSGTSTDILLLTSTSGATFQYLRNDTPGVSGSLSGTSFNGPLSLTLTNTTGSSQTVRFVIRMYTSSNYFTNSKVIFVTVLPSAAPTGNRCFAPSTPNPFPSGTDLSTYAKGSHIQLMADTTVSADTVKWYKVLGTDTSYAGSGYTLSVTVDTACQYIARNKNVCNCSTASTYHSAWKLMSNYSVSASNAPPALRMSNYMPTIASGTQIDIVPDIDSGAFNYYYIYRDNANVSGSTIAGSSILSVFGITLTNTSSVPQVVRYRFTSQATFGSTTVTGNTVTGYVTVLPSTSTAPAGNHCKLPAQTNLNAVANNCYVKGATINLDMNHVNVNHFEYTKVSVDSVNWYKVRWPGDTAYVGNTFPVNTVMDTPCSIYTVSRNVCYWSDSSKHIYTSARTKMLNASVGVGAMPALTLTNNAPNLCNGKATSISVSSAPGNVVIWLRDNAVPVKSTSLTGTLFTYPYTIRDTLTDTISVPQVVNFEAYSYTTISSRTCWGSSLLTSVTTYPTCGTWAANAIAIHPSNDTVCPGATATLTCDTLACNGGTRYVWSSGDTTRSINKTVAGTYTVTATNTCGCSATASATVVMRANPTPSVNNDTVCAGVTATLTVTGGTRYVWSTADTTSSISTALAGTYTVTAMNAYGCSATASGTVIINANPTPHINNDTICSGATAILTATGGMSYVWNNSATTASISTMTAGTYSVTATNALGCTATTVSSVTITVLSPPILASKSACSDTTHTFIFTNVIASMGADQIEWSLNSQFNSSTILSSPNTISISVLSTNADTLWIRSRNSLQGCFSAGAYSVLNNYPKPILKMGLIADTIIQDSAVILVPNSQYGIRYEIRFDSIVAANSFGTGYTLPFNVKIDTNKQPYLYSIDTVSGCFLKDTLISNPALFRAYGSGRDNTLRSGSSFCSPSIAWNKYYWYPRTDTLSLSLPLNYNPDGGWSGEDWFYDVSMAKDGNGKPIGYLGSGYTTLPQIFQAKNGCQNYTGSTDPLINAQIQASALIFDNTKPITNLGEYVDDLNVPTSDLSYTLWGHEDVLPKVALVDLKGNQIWYKVQGSLSTNGIQDLNTSGAGGRYYRAIQTSDHGYMGVGSLFGFSGLKYYNTTNANSVTTMSCSQLSATNNYKFGDFPYISKLDGNGNVIWQASYGIATIPTQQSKGYFYDIIPYQTLKNGNPYTDYVLVGKYSDYFYTTNQVMPMLIFMIEIDPIDGHIVRGGTVDLGTQLSLSSLNVSEARGGVYSTSSHSFYIDGYYRQMPASSGIACILKLNDDPTFSISATQTVPNTRGYQHDEAYYKLALVNGNNSLAATRLDDEMSDYGGMKFSENGAGTAVGFVDIYDLSLMNAPTVISVQEFHGEDLIMGITGTSDGGYAIASQVKENTPVDNCTDFFCPYSADNPCISHTYNKKYWHTNMFVAKFDASNNLQWTKEIKESTDATITGNHAIGDYANGNPNGTVPSIFGAIGDPRLQGDLKRQECAYAIIEGAEAGSLIIAGNNSNNLDDDNMVKLNSDCQSQLVCNTLIPNAASGGSSSGNAYMVPGVDPENDITINYGDNTTWSTDGYVYGTVRIRGGATLTIQNCTLQFLSTSKTNDNNNYDAAPPPLIATQNNPYPVFTSIVVEIGGKLIIDNSTLEGVQACADQWDGIEVWGNNSADQTPSNQGVVSMINGAVIKDAYTGINVQKYDRTLGTWNVDDSWGGGIIQVDNTNATLSPNFLNCRIGVRFTTYPGIGQTAQSASYFKYCNFVTDGNALNGLNTHAVLYDNHGASFTNCTFSCASSLPSSQPAYGIASFNSEYYLGEFNNAAKACTFTNLHRGQIAWGSSPSKFTGSPITSISNENTKFNDCDFALYYEGTDGCITNNCIINYTSAYQPYNTTMLPYGIYLEGVAGDYFCQNNTISYAGSYSGSGPQTGIIVADHADPTNPGNNQQSQGQPPPDAKIRANIITGISTGIAACGYNGINSDASIGLTTPRGLQFLCNQISNGIFDMAITGYNYQDGSTPDPGSMRNQGTCVASPGNPDLILTHPANNTFNSQVNIVVDNDVSSPFKYFFPYPNDGIPGLFNPTINQIVTIVDVHPCNINIFDLGNNSNAYASLCSPVEEKILITSGRPIIDILSQFGRYDSVKQTLINSVNGGNDSLAHLMVTNATAENISSVISTLAAYAAVTDDILISALENPYSYLAIEPMKALLEKNSALPDHVVEILKEVGLPFSSGELSEIVSFQNQLSPALAILSQISAVNAERIHYLYSVVYQWSKESRETDIDSLLIFDGNPGSLMMLVDRKLAHGYATEANTLLSRLQATNTFRSSAIELRQIESGQIANGKGLNQLDSMQLSTITAIASQTGGAERMRAKALILMNTGQGYQEYIPLIGRQTRSLFVPTPKPNPWAEMNTVGKKSLTVVPNPSTETATITTQLIDASIQSELRVTDMIGNIILIKTLVQQYDQTILPVANLAGGIYICAISQNGKTILNSKIVVTR